MKHQVRESWCEHLAAVGRAAANLVPVLGCGGCAAARALFPACAIGVASTYACSEAAAICLVFVTSCAIPAPPEPPGELGFELSAYDARGLAMPLQALPRRPEFVLSTTRPLAPIALALFVGEPDRELLEDLAALPLRAADDARLVASLGSQEQSRLRLAPREALAPGGTYTVALAGTAHAREGPALAEEGPAFMAVVRVSESASAGALWVATAPAAEASGVPPNLSAAFVALDGWVDGIDRGIWLETAAGYAVPVDARSVRCDEVDSRAAACVRLELGGVLQPRARYGLKSGRTLRDGHGAQVEALEAWFETGSDADAQPPGFEVLPCLPDEVVAAVGCIQVGDRDMQVHLRSDEPARVAIRSGGRQAAQLTAASDVHLQLEGFEPGEWFELEVTAVDFAGNTTRASLPLRTEPELASLSITEVLADPEGADAANEYVEIENFGHATVSLEGFALADASDGKPSVIESDVALPAGARALLVTNDFAAHETPEGVEIPAGTRLVRVGATLTKSGLANAGEALYLRDTDNRRLSATPAAPGSAGVCLQRSGGDPRSGEPKNFGLGACTPGR